MTVKDVIILGAGASKSEGAPLQNELFEDFLNAITEKILRINYHKTEIQG